MASGPSLMLLILLMMLLPMGAGIVLIVASRRRGGAFPKCGQCGYNVSASIGTTTRCPECGSEFGVVGITPAVARRNATTLWIGLAMIIVPTTCIGVGLLTSFAAHRASMSAQTRAAQIAAQAAAVQSQINLQQASLATKPADPARVAAFRPKVASMTITETSSRLSAIAQELAQRQADQALDEETAANLRAEFEALSEHLNNRPPAAPAQP